MTGSSLSAERGHSGYTMFYRSLFNILLKEVKHPLHFFYGNFLTWLFGLTGKYNKQRAEDEKDRQKKRECETELGIKWQSEIHIHQGIRLEKERERERGKTWNREWKRDKN